MSYLWFQKNHELFQKDTVRLSLKILKNLSNVGLFFSKASKAAVL